MALEVLTFSAWFRSYLINRRQYIECNGTKSIPHNISHSVPLGLILGSLLFLIYINDLPNVKSDVHFILYADDTTVLILVHKIIRDVNHIQSFNY